MSTERLLDVTMSLLREIVSVQQQNHFVARAYETPLSLAESHLLVELDADPSKTSTQLARALGLGKTTVSRIVSGLTAKGYLSSAHTDPDGRVKRLSFTRDGRNVLAQMDRNANRSIARFVDRLSQAELRKFERYLRAMNDGYGAPPCAARKGDHPLLMEGRRQTRGMGFLGSSAYGVGSLPLFDWHILVRLDELPARQTPTDLARFFRVPANTMSGALARLEKADYLYRRPAETDRRQTIVVASQSGLELLRKLEREARDRLAGALSDLSEGEIEEFATLFAKFAGRAGGQIVLQPRLSILRLNRDEDRSEARSFLVTQLARRGELHKLGETVIGRQSRSWALFREDRLQAVCEIRAGEGGAQISHFAAGPEIEGEETEGQFLAIAARSYLEETGGQTIRARESVLSPSLERQLANLTGR